MALSWTKNDNRLTTLAAWGRRSVALRLSTITFMIVPHPTPNVAPSTYRNAFLHEVIAAVDEATGVVEVQLT